MFFRKAGRYLNILYVFYFSFFVVLYFSLFKEYGFASETYSIHSILSSFRNINILISAIILLYFVEMVVTVKFLIAFFGKRESIGFYVFYILSSLAGFAFYFLFFAIVFYPGKNIVSNLRIVSLTEWPVLIVYFVMFFLILLFWKVVTYWKIKARLNYFGKYPGFKFLILPVNGFKLKRFLTFLLFVSFVVLVPLAIFTAGILNKSEILMLLSVILTYILFPFSKLYVYYLLLDKKEI